MMSYVVPALLLVVSALALRKKADPYSMMLEGGKEGLTLVMTLIPALVALLTSVMMLRASCAVQVLSTWCTPLFRLLGIPPETAILVLIRPISGSAALAVGADLISQYGPDSLIGRTTAVMLGSTETTFYIISVYFSACGIKRTRYAIPAALAADLTGFVMASLSARLFFQ